MRRILVIFLLADIFTCFRLEVSIFKIIIRMSHLMMVACFQFIWSQPERAIIRVVVAHGAAFHAKFKFFRHHLIVNSGLVIMGILNMQHGPNCFPEFRPLQIKRCLSFFQRNGPARRQSF